MATLVNYTCKSFIKLAPDKFKGPVHKNPGKEKCPDAKKMWTWLNYDYSLPDSAEY